ncbi:hypothetical protein I4U23_000067 [Adineta vaga]|nr:hypothetical protein I4U23_000067 [Adineta vaga]
MAYAGEGEEIAGTNTQSDPINASYDSVWNAMMDNVYHPEKYLPYMKLLSIVDKGDHFVRQVGIGDPKPMTEEIYCDKEKGEIRFEHFVTRIHVNKYHREEQVLEYYTDESDGRRVFWCRPKSMVAPAMQKTKELAEAQSK